MQDYNQDLILRDLLNNDSFVRWLRDESSPDRSYWESWVVERPDRVVLVQEARALLQQFTEVVGAVVSDEDLKGEIWNSLQDVIVERRMFWSRQVIAIAASVIFVLSGLGIWYWTSYKHTTTEVLATSSVVRYTLPDGSVVILNKGGRLQYDRDMANARTREVRLEGEGFFEVRPKKSPFIVRSGTYSIEVLGTQFDVCNQPMECSVVLRSGAVALRNGNNRVILAPDEMGILSKNRIDTSRVNSKLFVGWIDGKLTLDNTSFAEILRVLHYSFGYTIHSNLSPDKLSQSISGTVNVNDRAQLIRTLALLLNVHITEQNHIITITNY